MKTTTIYRKLKQGTVILAGILRDLANRPRLSRRLGYRADEIQQELDWRAENALTGQR